MQHGETEADLVNHVREKRKPAVRFQCLLAALCCPHVLLTQQASHDLGLVCTDVVNEPLIAVLGLVKQRRVARVATTG